MSLLGLLQATALQAYLKKNGKFPPVSLQIKPLDRFKRSVEFFQFTDYSFQDSVLVPISAFSFSFMNPTEGGSLLDYVRDGDIAVLKANGTVIATGIIDTVSIDTEAQSGETVHVQGRSLIGQLEDQSAVNEKQAPIYGNKNNFSLDQVIKALMADTRINHYRKQSTLSGQFLFATEPGESKLSALMRFIEPLNYIAWSDPDGTLVVGKPNMGDSPSGTLIMDRGNRRSNCTGIKAIYSSTQIPNIVIPVWSGQETVQDKLPEQAFKNRASGPSRLLSLGHRVPKCIVSSTPQGADPQSQSLVNLITVAGSNILQAYAKREFARANVHELAVQANVQGHYNDDLSPIMVDTTYQVEYPRAGISGEQLYAHTVDYSLSREQGQRTQIFLCRLGCIVADTPVPPRSLSALTRIPTGLIG